MRLTAEQYEILRRLNRNEMTVRDVAAEAGVSLGTVVGFRRACETVDAMSPLLREKIRRLLWSKAKASRIAAILSVPVESVRHLRRIDRFRESPDGASECSKCGARFFAPLPVHRRTAIIYEECDISRESLNDILRVVQDLLDLNDLFLIANPLFHHLSKRAERAYEQIHKETAKEEGADG